MNASELEWLKNHPEIDKAFSAGIALAQDTLERGGRGEAGITLIFNDQSVSYRERKDVHYKPIKSVKRPIH